MIVEEFDGKFRDFFSRNKNALDRWPQLSALFTTDYKSARVLFMTEVLALIDKWKEPTAEELNRILFHVLDGGHVAFPPRSIWNMLLSVWPLEVAKYNASMLRTFAADARFKRYPMTLVTLSSTALVQAWWALETLMNDLGAIIGEQRKTIDATDRILLEERTISLNDKGQAADRQNYQPIDARIQFIYHLLTGEQIDRSSKDWMHLMELKNARDGFVHRLGKTKSSPLASFIDPDTALKGLKAAQNVIADVFANTPEFAGRWTYGFLRYWSCCTDSPWIWDGCQGDVFHLGPGKVDFDTIMALGNSHSNNAPSCLSVNGRWEARRSHRPAVCRSQAVKRTGTTPCCKLRSRFPRSKRSRLLFARKGRKRIASLDTNRSDRRKVWTCFR